MKEPKRYECKDCGFVSSRSKTKKFPMMSFAICFKCRGHLKERDEWLEWYHNGLSEWRKGIVRQHKPSEYKE